jgi:gluconokinase
MPGDELQAQLKRTGLPPCGIVAMGVSGCGKSTLVEHLAARLAVPAFEGDAFHSSASVAKMRAGKPLDDDDRWPWLDRLGESIGAAVREHGSAVSACSALKRSYRERLERAAGVPLMFVLLDGGRGDIAPRLAARANHYMAPALLDSQFATLERPAADENALVLHCYRPVEDLGSDVIAWAQARLVS